jgi:hypothetical protein
MGKQKKKNIADNVRNKRKEKIAYMYTFKIMLDISVIQ